MWETSTDIKFSPVKLLVGGESKIEFLALLARRGG